VSQVISDHTLKDHLDAQLIELLRKIQRIRI